MLDTQGPRRILAAAAAAIITFIFLYWHVIVKLVRDWSVDENYSHGFLILPIAVYFGWERREQLGRAMLRPSLWGLPIVVGSLAILLAGVLGAELFLTRISMIGVLSGVVIFVLGWQFARILAFPLAFLVLMIPVPAILFNQVAFPLQLVASRAGELALNLWQIPVLREGNVIVLANMSLEVAEACSGIRSLVSLITLAIMFGHFAESRRWARITLVLAAIPVAVLSNGLRVAGTGIAAHYFGAAAAEGFIHTFSGWLVFFVAFGFLLMIQRALAFTRRPRSAAANTPEAVAI